MIRYEQEVDPLVSLSLQNFSYSRLKTYEECPQRYFYAYVIKEEQTFGMAAELGNIIHKALEVTIEDMYDFDPVELQRNYLAYVAEMDPNNRIPPSMISEGADMLTEYVKANPDRDKDFPHEPVSGEDYHTELSFSIIIGRGRFNGFIDNVLVKPDRVEITDYKCVTADTKFWRLDGTQAIVSELVPGEHIIGWNEETGLHPTKITDIFSNGRQAIVSISTLNGRSLKVTRNHPVLTQRGWVDAGELESNDRIHVGLNLNHMYKELGMYPPMDTDVVLPEANLVAEFLTVGPFSSYLLFQDDFLVFNRDYWKEVLGLAFKGKYRTNTCNMTTAEDIQFVLAQMGINSRIAMSMGSWFVEIDSDSKMSMLNMMMTGEEPKNFTATDKVTGMFPVGSEETWGVTVSDNHTHITDGLVTHNSGKWEVAAKHIAKDLQLGTYSLVASQMFPDREIHAELYYLRSGKRKGHTFSEEDLAEVEVKLTEKVEKVLTAEHFPPTPNERACEWCSFSKNGVCQIGANRLRKRGKIQ